MGIFSLLATFFELSQAVPIPADPYHEEKLGRVKIQVRKALKSRNLGLAFKPSSVYIS